MQHIRMTKSLGLKIISGGKESVRELRFGTMLAVKKIQKTDDPDYVNVFFEDGSIAKDVLRDIFSVHGNVRIEDAPKASPKKKLGLFEPKIKMAADMSVDTPDITKK